MVMVVEFVGLQKIHSFDCFVALGHSGLKVTDLEVDSDCRLLNADLRVPEADGLEMDSFADVEILSKNGH
jgi:hypothetical protein